MLRRKGFTLAEVLIALLLVGILSSISIQTLRNRDNSSEYEAIRNKAVTNVQGVLHEALYAEKSSEIFSGENGNYNDIMNHLNSRLGVASATIIGTDSGNGEISAQGQKMRDGSYYALTQKEGNSFVAELTIDVNGNKAPNKEGSDIFKYNVDKFGGILLTTVPDTEPEKEKEKEYCPDGVTVKQSGVECPKCADGSYVQKDKPCLQLCPDETTWVADLSACPKCADGSYKKKNVPCKTLCPDGKTWVEEGKPCLIECPDKSFAKALALCPKYCCNCDKPHLACPRCIDGNSYTPYATGCGEPKCVVQKCSKGMFFDKEKCMCVNNCSEGEVFNKSSGQCEPILL